MTLIELIKQYMAESGVEETVAVRVTFNDSETLVIAGDNHPMLEREVGDGSGVKLALSQSARAGLSGSIVDPLMKDVKTDISLSGDLLTQARSVANEMNISLDRLFAFSVEGFIQRYYRNRQAMEQLHQAYENDPGEEERQWLALALESHRRLQLDAGSEPKNPDQLSNEEFEKLLDELVDLTRRAVPPGTPPLSDYALSRESFYEDHPKL